eukprot:TRINITY_DN2187_c0_g1_i1.p1 TRINITY_DN2187_c0_g1~~TRINITY_DN2187_c0_g1_i1.p1  ORF type:complete len:156 (-),score=60.02 TRINITY_DN2187_c0_g1_i1:223-690(-)
MNGTLTRTDRILRGLKSIGGSIRNWLTKPKKAEDTRFGFSSTSSSSSASSSSTSSTVSSSASRSVLFSSSSSLTSSSSSSSSSSHLNEKQLHRDKVVEDQLDAILNAVSNMSNQGVLMKEELEVQNQMLDHIDTNVDVTRYKVKKQTKTMKEIVD